MASFFKRGDIWVVRINGRGQITLGRDARKAATISGMVERLEAASKHGLPIDPDVTRWVSRTSGKLRRRLVALGLIDDESKKTLGDLAKKWERMNRGKDNTVRMRTNAAQCVLHHFGESRTVESITEADAVEYEQWLTDHGRRGRSGEFTGKPLASATVSKRIKRTRKMFKLAIKSRWIETNPFDGVKTTMEVNEKRLFFVPPEWFDKIVAELPTVEDRTVFALARWAGMRTPSEPSLLKWSDINWSGRSMNFQCPKTEHNKGMARRTCPIFPQLMPFLESAYEAANDGDVFVCPRIASVANAARRLRQVLTAAIVRAGFEPWPRLWNNLRATRATEIVDAFGAKAESKWIGHGEETGFRSYFMVTDEKFRRAAGFETTNSSEKTTDSPISELEI